MDAGHVQVVCDATAQLMPHLIEYGGQNPKDRKPEDDEPPSALSPPQSTTSRG